MAETSDGRVWLITGTSSGLGRALAEAVAARGDRLVAAVRRTETNDDLVAEAPDRVKVVRTDVTSTKDAHEAVEAAVRGFGRIDAVVNNAGFGLLGGVEEATEFGRRPVRRARPCGGAGRVGVGHRFHRLRHG